MGPTDTSGYSGTPLDNKVVLQDGSQMRSLPISGTYLTEAGGASGSNGSSYGIKSGWRLGGLGARVAKGTRLKVVVGQQGLLKQGFGTGITGGGGGGTFVTLITGEPLIMYYLKQHSLSG